MLIIILLILEPTKLPSLLQSILLLLFVSEVRLEVLELEVLEFLERVIFICIFLQIGNSDIYTKMA
jgi:hypothetical protein